MSVIELSRSTAREREHEQWWDDATVIAGELNHWHAQLVDLTARVIAADAWGAHGGIRSPAHWLALRAGLSPATAAHIVTLAQARARMPIVTGLFESGRLSLDQAVVIASRVPAAFEESVCELAPKMTVTQLRRATSRYFFDDDSTETTKTSDQSSDDQTADKPRADERGADEQGAHRHRADDTGTGDTGTGAPGVPGHDESGHDESGHDETGHDDTNTNADDAADCDADDEADDEADDRGVGDPAGSLWPGRRVRPVDPHRYARVSSRCSGTGTGSTCEAASTPPTGR